MSNDEQLLMDCQLALEKITENLPHGFWNCTGDKGCYTESDTNAGIHSPECISEYEDHTEATLDALERRLHNVQ